MLCLCFVITGCSGRDKVTEKTLTKNKDNETILSGEKDKEEVAPKENTIEVNSSEEQPLKLSKSWSVKTTLEKALPPFNSPEYVAKVKAYKIAPDLSNVENKDFFTGFTEEQKRMIAKNGFIVLPSRDTKMHYIYDSNEYSAVPNFVTTDSVLHLYHLLYDKTLTGIEQSVLYEKTERMTEHMLQNSIHVLAMLEDEKLQQLQEKNIIYFLVAHMLMKNSQEISIPVKKHLLEIAQMEFKKIQEASGLDVSPLFSFDVDYSQFKVRGHYTRTEELGRYFKTMMWYGFVPLQFTNRDEYLYENVLRALLITYTAMLEKNGICSAKDWSDIYIPTAQYVGLSDDINLFAMNELRQSVFQDTEDPNLFANETYYEALYEAVKQLPEPKIQAQMIERNTPTGKQFRFMGQRYILDSYIMQKLTETIKRPIPSGLDVMGVLGSDVAEQLLLNVYQPQKKWPEYTEKYQKLKKDVSGYDTDLWGSNLYNGWLWTIKEAFKEFDQSSGMPFFMTTKAWKKKALNTALGSFTELKHDTVLYGKQSMAQMGGPVDMNSKHYVEPNVVLYSKLYYLTDLTLLTLEERGMLNDRFLEAINSYKELLNLLINCSIKVLRNEEINEEEKKRLLWYGGTMENITNNLLTGMTGESVVTETTHMLASDVATYRNTYLTLGTGYFDHIYVVVPVNGKLYLTRGSVFSHYEFVSDTRLTDEEWWELQGIKVIKSEFGDYTEITEPSKNLPKQPDWVNEFKSNKNDVKVNYNEIDWDKLSE